MLVEKGSDFYMFTVGHQEQYLAWCEHTPKLSDIFPKMVGHEVCKPDKAP